MWKPRLVLSSCDVIVTNFRLDYFPISVSLIVNMLDEFDCLEHRKLKFFFIKKKVVKTFLPLNRFSSYLSIKDCFLEDGILFSFS